MSFLSNEHLCIKHFIIKKINTFITLKNLKKKSFLNIFRTKIFLFEKQQTLCNTLKHFYCTINNNFLSIFQQSQSNKTINQSISQSNNQSIKSVSQLNQCKFIHFYYNHHQANRNYIIFLFIFFSLIHHFFFLFLFLFHFFIVF